ncbi:MAG: polymerase subunit gamma/tau, partial [Alphaproteobacteria bacterium]|nr:polymerase subunit gamma/tau [Alphaproteobacteria bacterium]
LSRTWQMLFKGIADVQSAPKPLAAAEMVLVRIAYAADLPAPEDVIRSLSDGGDAATARGPSGNGGAAASAGSAPRPALQQARGSAQPMRAPAPSSAPRAQLAPAAVQEVATDAAPLVVGKFEDLIALAAEKRDLQMKISLERDVRLVRFEDGQLEIALEAGASKALVHDLARKLSIWTGRRWMVVVSAEAGAPTVKAQAETRQQELQTGVAADPLVQAVLNRFPGSQIVGVRARGAPEEPPPLSDVPPVDDGSAFDAEVPADDGDDDL